jgi:hypothetical protein
LLPGDAKAADALMLLEDLDEEQKGWHTMDRSFSLTEVQDCVLAQCHLSGIYIVLDNHSPAMEGALLPSEHWIDPTSRWALSLQLGKSSVRVGRRDGSSE